jgi:hypothetical protein
MAKAEIERELSEYELLLEEAKRIGLSIPLQAPFTPTDINRLMPLLRMSLSEVAIQSAKSSETGRTYDSVGYSYQAHIDRMNWIFGPTQWTWKISNEVCEDSATAGGYLKYIFSCEITLEIGYRVLNEENKEWEWLTVYSLPPVPTDHESLEKGSARKGCLTKGIKRATSFLGVGADAYLGILDDDLVTGSVTGDQMKTPKHAKEKFIDSKEYIKLMNLAALKGLPEDTRLREYYRIESDGRITNDPSNLTKTEVSEVKGYLFALPNAPVESDEDESVEPEYSVEENQTESPKRPKTLSELIAAPEDTIRNLAAEFSIHLPKSLSERGKSAICNTLAALMKLT